MSVVTLGSAPTSCWNSEVSTFNVKETVLNELRRERSHLETCSQWQHRFQRRLIQATLCNGSSKSMHSREQVVSNRVLPHPPAKAMCPDMGDYSMASEHQSRTVVATILRRSVSGISNLLCCLDGWSRRHHTSHTLDSIKTCEHVHRAESNRLRNMAEKRWNLSARRTVNLEQRRRDLPECPRQHSQTETMWKKDSPSSNRPQRRVHLQKSPRALPSTSAVDTELRSVHFRGLRGGCGLYTALYTAEVPECCGHFGWRPSGEPFGA